jgi:signal transduction histidine kinase
MQSPQSKERRGAHVFSGQVWSLLVQAPSTEVKNIPPDDSIVPALQNIRQVLYDVREESPLDTGFVKRVRALLDNLEAGTAIHAKLRVSVVWPSSIPVVIGHKLYGIVKEALNNVRMHSHASSVEVHLAAEVDGVSLVVRDDGRGMHWFDDAVRQGMGILGMQERAVLLGGHMDVISTAGRGTTVRVVAPPW